MNEPSSLPATAYLRQSLSGLFDTAFDLYKRRFLLFALIAALIYLPTQLLLAGVESIWLYPMAQRLEAVETGENLAEAFLVTVGYLLVGLPRYGVPGLVSLLSFILISAPITVAVSDLVLGRSATVKSAFRRALPFWPRVLAGWTGGALAFLGVYVMLLVALMLVVLLIIGALAQFLPEEVGVLLVLLVLVGPYVVCAALVAKWFCLTTPLATLEAQPLSLLPARNGDLVGKMRFRRAWASVLFLPLVTFGLQFLMTLAVYLALEVAPLPPVAQFLMGTALATAITIFFHTFWMIFLTLFYYDYRIQKEGLDLQLFAAQLPPSPPLAPIIPPLPPIVPRAAPIVPPLPAAPTEGGRS